MEQLGPKCKPQQYLKSVIWERKDVVEETRRDVPILTFDLSFHLLIWLSRELAIDFIPLEPKAPEPRPNSLPELVSESRNNK